MYHFSRIYKIKPGKFDEFKAWMESLQSEHREEALATFEAEGIVEETYVLFKGYNGDDYVLGLNVTSDGLIELGDAEIPVNKKHNEVKRKCLEDISDPGQVLLHLKK